MAPYARALAREVRLVGEVAAGRRVHTIFFGGGTPSLLPLLAYQDIFAALLGSFALTTDCEITLEANPGTVDAAYLQGLRALGVSRLSFGVQSTHASELRLLDRLHSFEDVRQAVALARAAGFDRDSHGLNLDLILGAPHQTLAMWQASLLRVLVLEPEHLSLYALSLEHGTPLRSWVQRGLLPMPDADLAAEMYGWAAETLAAHGYAQYEISNWALKGKAEVRDQRSETRGSDVGLLTSSLYQCRHNLQYWRNWPYLGLGAGAHGCAGGWRYSNVLAPGAYVARLEQGAKDEFPFSPAAVERTRQTRADEMGETMMLGLRLTGEGVRAAAFEARFGTTLGAAYGRRLRHLRRLGLLAWDEAGVRLTPAGRLLGNRVFREFV